MNNATQNTEIEHCPFGIPWCSVHLLEQQQCSSHPIDLSPRLSVWLLAEIPGIEPEVVIDKSPGLPAISLEEASGLAAALHELREALDEGRAVRS